MKGSAYAAGTIINALATGTGCAFGLNLKTRVKLSVDDLKRCIVLENGEEKENSIVDRVLLSTGCKCAVEVKSGIPKMRFGK